MLIYIDLGATSKPKISKKNPPGNIENSNASVYQTKSPALIASFSLSDFMSRHLFTIS